MKYLTKLSLFTLGLTIINPQGLLSAEDPMIGLNSAAEPKTQPKGGEMTISSITPIQPEMNPEQAKKAIITFFHNNVSLDDDFIRPSNIKKQEMVQSDPSGDYVVLETLYDADNRKAKSNTGTVCGNPELGRIFQLMTLKDGTRWVQGNGNFERFVGSIYLQKSIEAHSLTEKWRAVRTKLYLKPTSKDCSITIKIKHPRKGSLQNIFTIDSPNLLSFSEYVGNGKFDTNDTTLPRGELLRLTGFSDTPGNVNLVPREGTEQVTIIDTEYSSFSNTGTTPPSEEAEALLGGKTFVFSLEDLFKH